jgi:60S ribosome subunit biogenesis protein NIP7
MEHAGTTSEARKLEPMGTVVFHQADVGECLRDEETLF